MSERSSLNGVIPPQKSVYLFDLAFQLHRHPWNEVEERELPFLLRQFILHDRSSVHANHDRIVDAKEGARTHGS